MATVAHVQPRRKSYPALGPDRLFGAPSPAPAPAPAPPAAEAEARPRKARARAKAPVEFSAAWLDDACETALINGKLYAVEPVQVDPRSGVATCYALTSEAGDVYHVADHRDRPSTCTCGDFVFRCEDVDPLGCKHVKALVALDCLANDVGRLAARAAADAAAGVPMDALRREALATHRRGTGL